MISTVDPETRHGHKTAARGFDGHKGHVGLDPDSEIIITATAVTAGNVGDARVAEDPYGTGQFQDRLDRAGIESKCKTQQPVAAAGLFTKTSSASTSSRTA